MTEKVEHKKFYSMYESWKNWKEVPFGSYSCKENYYFRNLLEKRLNGSDINILELGFGNGALAGWLYECHPQIKWNGVEIQEDLVVKASNAGFNAKLGLDSTTFDCKFDLVIALDVLEHLTDHQIAKLFQDLSAMVDRKGCVLARTPNGAGPFGLPNQSGDPTHITAISVSRLSAYLPDWTIESFNDNRPLWEGKVLGLIRNCIRALIQSIIVSVVRFAFAPQPKTLLASNILLTFKLRN